MNSSSSGRRPTRRKGIDEFGSDILHRIFSRLPPVSLVFCTAVCSSWHNAINLAPNLWRSAYFLDHARLEPRNIETASSHDNADVDCRTRYIDEEQRTRLAHGRVSVRAWKAHSGRVTCCRMVMGQIVSGSNDQRVRIWSAKTLTCMEQYIVPEKATVLQVEFDENKVMGAAGKNVLLWSRRGNRRLLRSMGGHSNIYSMCVADSDLATGCYDGTVRIYDLYSSRCTQIFRLHRQPVKALVMDMATGQMASGSSDGTVQLYDAQSGQKIASLLRASSMPEITCMHLSALDHKLFAGDMRGDVYCFDLRSRKTVWKKQVAGTGLTCMHGPMYSDSAIGVGGVDGRIKVFEGDSAEIIATFKFRERQLPSSPVLSMALGVTKLVSCHSDSRMIMWQLGESESVSARNGVNYGREVLEVLNESRQ